MIKLVAGYRFDHDVTLCEGESLWSIKTSNPMDELTILVNGDEGIEEIIEEAIWIVRWKFGKAVKFVGVEPIEED